MGRGVVGRMWTPYGEFTERDIEPSVGIFRSSHDKGINDKADLSVRHNIDIVALFILAIRK